eukprot:Gb_04522 [translate_table: standard]
MLMHAPAGVEVEDAPEGKEPLQGIDAREPLQITWEAIEVHRYAVKLSSNGETRDREKRRDEEMKAPLRCQIAERWRDKELGNLLGVGRVVCRGVSKHQFEQQSLVANWSEELGDLSTGGIRASALMTKRKRPCDGLKSEDLNSKLGNELFMWLGDQLIPPSEAVRGLAVVSQQCGYFICIPRQLILWVVSDELNTDKHQSCVHRYRRRGPVNRQDLGRQEGGRQQCVRRRTDVRRFVGGGWDTDGRLGLPMTTVGRRLCRYRPPTGRISESMKRQKFRRVKRVPCPRCIIGIRAALVAVARSAAHPMLLISEPEPEPWNGNIRAWVQSQSQSYGSIGTQEPNIITAGIEHREFRAQWQSRVIVDMESPERRSTATAIGVSKEEFGGNQSWPGRRAEVEDVPEGKESLQGIDAREPLQIAREAIEVHRYAVKLRSNGETRDRLVSWSLQRYMRAKARRTVYSGKPGVSVGSREKIRDKEMKASLRCQIAERWRDKELGNLPGVGRVVCRGVSKHQFEWQSLVASWSEELGNLSTRGIRASTLVTKRTRPCDGLKSEDLNSKLGNELFMWLGDQRIPPSEAVGGLAVVSQQCGYFICIPRQLDYLVKVALSRLVLSSYWLYLQTEAGEALCYSACDMRMPDRPPM